ncbi:MAG TPA: permease-like cell division protein FtsX [Mycobacteriales bacterium]|nr:permease-like cell division protein FtsX [Mycobacteriales bacterium]
MRLRFILSETWLGLIRNVSMLAALVLTVVISLGMLGSALLASKQISTMKDFWFDKIQVSVFLTKDVTQPQRDAIASELNHLPQVKRVYYESQSQACARFRKQFQDVKSLVDNTPCSALPESYRVQLKDPQKYLVVSSAVQNMPGVDEVQGRSKALERFFRLLNKGQAAGLFAAGVALLAAVLLILNTVRMSAMSRRRETRIMRLVGASDLYIQGPFVLEGAVAGLIGGIGASLGVVLVKVLLIDGGVHAMFGNVVNYVGWNDVLSIVPILLVVGVLLAGLTSLLTLQRYLRV